MKFEKEYYVQIRDIGLKNKMTNYAILGKLEEIASEHSNTVGYGVKDIEKKKRAWLLMDWKLKVTERPEYGQKLKIKTWARTNKKQQFFTYRDFEMLEGDKRIAIATSKWVLFNSETNRISKITDDINNLYHPEEESVFEEKDIAKIKEQNEIGQAINYEVKRADIDINKHMHNLNYLQLAYEALPEDIYLGNEKNNVRIMYKHQILLGDKVKCHYTSLNEKDIITIKSEDNGSLHSIIELS